MKLSSEGKDNTMAEISISIENNYFEGDNNMIATFNIKSCNM